MTKQIEELKRTSQQGSMQIQGEVGELELEKILKDLFPFDEISEVKKGELGGDVRQIVRTQRGTECGMILWERKRTKVWTEEWVNKLREDMQRDKAHIGAIVTEVLPKNFKKQIGEKSGVWVTTMAFVEPLAMLLRKVLYDVAKEKAVKLNKQSKADEIYDFVTSMEFNQQVERISLIYQDMKGEISKERAVAERQWKQREMQVNRLITGVSGIYGSIQGIAGSALPQVKSLELPDVDDNVSSDQNPFMERSLEYQKGKNGGDGEQKKQNWPTNKKDKPKPEANGKLTDIFRKWHPQRVKRPR